jgi:hypothetical protein
MFVNVIRVAFLSERISVPYIFFEKFVVENDVGVLSINGSNNGLTL